MAQIAGFDDNGNPLYVQADGSISSVDPDALPPSQAQRAQDIYNRTGQNVQQTMAEARRMFEQSGIQQAYPGVTFEQYLQIHGINPIDVNGEQWASYPTKEFNWGLGTQTDLGEALKVAGLAFGGMAGLNGLGLLGGAEAAAAGAGASPYSLGAANLGTGASALPNALGSYGSLGSAAAGEIGAGLGASLGTGSITGLPGATSLTGLDSLLQGGSSLPNMPTTSNIPGTNLPTLPTAPGTTGTIIDGVPPVGAAAGVAGAASGASGGLSQVLKDTFGLDIGADALKTLGTLGGTALGVVGSMNQTKTLKDLADREFGVRQPFIDLAKNAAQNPDSWYNSAPAMGATDAVLRKLSVNGNPALNPGDLSKAAAYNLGGYSDYLGKVGGLALGSAPASISLGKDIAGSEGNTLNALGAGLADLTNPRQDWTKILAQMQRGNWLA